MPSRLRSAVTDWAQNLRRLLVPRPPWRAEAEFAFYRVEPSALHEQLERQRRWWRQGQLVGLGVVDALGLLDRDRLAGLRVLEIGAGECMLGQALQQAGAAEVWAVDAVPKQIWAAAAHASQREQSGEGGRLHCVIADVLDLPFVEGSFDLVVANLVLHHIRPLTGLLGEVLRVLAHGGQFVALEPAPLVGMLVHDQTSDNEAPLWPGAVTETLTRSGFVLAAHEYQWVRLRSSVLGPLSPSYWVSAQRPGPAETARLRLVRELAPSVLPGLKVDTGCRFAALVNEQVAAISECVEQQGLLKRR